MTQIASKKKFWSHIFLDALSLKKKKNWKWYSFLICPYWTHENCFLNRIISKTTHHKISMKIYSERTKLALCKNVSFYLKIFFVVLINYIKDVVSLVHLLWKIEWKSIRIQKNTHFIFSLESLVISLYNNIFYLMLTNKFCHKNGHLFKSHILAKFQNSYTQI